jgi:hypothetical protein
MSGLKVRASFAVIGALCLAVILPSTAAAHHLAGDVPDGSNPDVIVRNNQVCSATAITPGISGDNYYKTIGGWLYSLRYSTNCRSVWARASVDAPRRADLATFRQADSNVGSYCTNDIHYHGNTWYWTGQVDVLGHMARVRLDDLSHDCSGTYTWRSWVYPPG